MKYHKQTSEWKTMNSRGIGLTANVVTSIYKVEATQMQCT